MLLNDDYTPWSSWWRCSSTSFITTEITAQGIMLHIHQQWRGGRGRLHLRGRGDQGGDGQELAEKAEFPLQCTMDSRRRRRRNARRTMTIRKEIEGYAIQVAFDEARRRRHELVTLKHVLFGLTERSGGGRSRHAGANLKKLDKELEQFFDDNMPELPEGPEGASRSRRRRSGGRCSARRCTCSRRAKSHRRRKPVVAFYRERDSHAVWLLEQQGVKRLDVLTSSRTGSRKDREDASWRGARARATRAIR